MWYLHLAGDWSEAFETEASAIRPHMMRCMLVSNLALDQRFALVDGISGETLGSLANWSITASIQGSPGGLAQAMALTCSVNWNGTQGRLLCWYPEKAETRKALQSSYPELFARFVKESSLRKPELLADIDS